MRQLTLKQTCFVAAHLARGNASEAYRRAYNAAGMKPGTINDKACALLKHDGIRAAIEAAKRKLIDASVVTAEGLTADLLEVAQEARRGDGWGAAVSAYRTVALVHGLITKKVDVATQGCEFHIIRRLPDETTSEAMSAATDR